jgi:sporulation protein YlmC with PRC-barrel domain
MLEYHSLRYIDASHVASGVTDLAGFDVLTATGRKLGALEGLIVDPPERSIKFAVVDGNNQPHSGRLLVPISLAQLDMSRKSLRVDLENDGECPAFDPEDFPTFSIKDSQAAMFTARFRLPN